MNDPSPESPAQKLVQAYNRMMERVKAGIEEAEEQAIPKLRENIDKAAELAVELEELTVEEAQKIAMYLRRDLHDAGQYLAESGEELGGWLRFDIGQIEDRLLEVISRVADKTRVEIAALQHELEQDPPHHSGEITGPGTLYCSDCGQAVHFHQTGHIPPCPKCHGSNFRRGRVEKVDASEQP